MLVQVVTTIDSREAALALARSAVTGKIAACAQVGGPITSVYHWEGRIEESQEWTVVFKTPADGYAALETHIKEQHSYDVPEILATPVSAASQDYANWVRSATAP